jgi:hypothetical protein
MEKKEEKQRKEILLIGYNLTSSNSDDQDIDYPIRDAALNNKHVSITALYADTSVDGTLTTIIKGTEGTHITNIAAGGTEEKSSELVGIEHIESTKKKFDVIQLPLFGLKQLKGTISRIFNLLKDNGKLITFEDAHKNFVDEELGIGEPVKEFYCVEDELGIDKPQAKRPRLVYTKLPSLRFR